MYKMRKRLSLFLIMVMLALPYSFVLAADNDGWTEAAKTEQAQNGTWEDWCKEWETIKDNPTQMSLTPGKDASQLNFSWYSNATDKPAKLKISKRKDLKDAIQLKVITTDAVEGYRSNKAVATGLKNNTTYYYSYTINGKWTKGVKYETQDTKSYSFLFVGDPQIGSSAANVPAGSKEEQGQSNAVRNDSFNWNNTLNEALKRNSKISFAISAGDQIQTRDKKTPEKTYKTFDENEIEYAGYLSADALASLPVATSIGNHDTNSANYTYHFNNPNASKTLGDTYAGTDYYFSYGNTLYIMLNTNNVNIVEHKQFIDKAIASHKDAKWKIVTMHQDIYGAGEHSNEPEIVSLRYALAPIFEKNGIDVVLTGHDHTYSRSFIMNGGVADMSSMLSEEEYEKFFEEDLAAVSHTSYLSSNIMYKNYLNAVQDLYAIVKRNPNKVINPQGVLYLTAGSSTGSKYYDLMGTKQAYLASRWQKDVPTYTLIDVTDTTLKINTYRTDNGEKIDTIFTIQKK
ncbi:MAG TPA: metallophosphoesterase family protein [Lachnospiraceae bacterium]|nr:metallophosphoesterase family protein [Lachnospiraceae bacterium]